MNIVTKLAGAVALALVAGGTQAALISGENGDKNAELFVIAYDPVSTNTFIKDLGITFSSLVPRLSDPSLTYRFDLGALVTPGTGAGQFTFAPGVRWTVAAGVFSDGSEGFFDSSNNGALVTVNPSSNVGPLNPLQTFPNAVANLDASLKLESYIQIVNQKAQLVRVEGLNQAGVENDHFVAGTDQASTFYDRWGDNLGTRFPSGAFSSGEVGLDDFLAFYFWSNDTGDNVDDLDGWFVNTSVAANVWRLDATGELTYAPVPIPAAAWLLGSALVGLITVSRRRRAASVV